jgi:hypothetical protein
MTLESPFELFAPTVAISVGIGAATMGMLLAGVVASPLGGMLNCRQRVLLPVLAGVGTLGFVMETPPLRTAWTWLALGYAVLTPLAVTLVGVRALVGRTDGT